MELELGLKLARIVDDFTAAEFQLAKDRSGPLFLSSETDTMFILTAHLKGHRRREIKIDINEDGTRIAVSGEKLVQETVMVGWKVYRKGVEVRKFRKAFKIPDGVILDKIKAKFNEDGCTLTISMPKKEKGIRGVSIQEIEEQELAPKQDSDSLQILADEGPDQKDNTRMNARPLQETGPGNENFPGKLEVKRGKQPEEFYSQKAEPGDKNFPKKLEEMGGKQPEEFYSQTAEPGDEHFPETLKEKREKQPEEFYFHKAEPRDENFPGELKERGGKQPEEFYPQKAEPGDEIFPGKLEERGGKQPEDFYSQKAEPGEVKAVKMNSQEIEEEQFHENENVEATMQDGATSLPSSVMAEDVEEKKGPEAKPEEQTAKPKEEEKQEEKEIGTEEEKKGGEYDNQVAEQAESPGLKQMEVDNIDSGNGVGGEAARKKAKDVEESQEDKGGEVKDQKDDEEDRGERREEERRNERKLVCDPILAGSAIILSLVAIVIHFIRSNSQPAKRRE